MSFAVHSTSADALPADYVCRVEVITIVGLNIEFFNCGWKSGGNCQWQILRMQPCHWSHSATSRVDPVPWTA